jgi:hypothetical protein
MFDTVAGIRANQQSHNLNLDVLVDLRFCSERSAFLYE